MSFVHLHVHTEYSLLDGSSKIGEITRRAKELGMDSLAITDHGVMYGVVDFYKAAKANGIKPIIGCEVYVAPGSRFDKEAGAGEERYFHLVLLAENRTGYQNLIKIVSKGFVEGFYYKPRVDYELLKEYREGIIALSACLAGEVQRYLAKGLYEQGRDAALKYAEIFGKDNFFLEMQDHGIREQQIVNQQLMRMSEELSIGLVCTNDVHYTYAEDAAAHDILLCIQTGKKVSDENRMRYEGGQYYLKSPEEMEALFRYAPQAIENTQRIAKRCNVEFEFGVTKLPKYDVPDGYDSFTYLNELCFEGLKKRYPEAFPYISGKSGAARVISSDNNPSGELSYAGDSSDNKTVSAENTASPADHTAMPGDEASDEKQEKSKDSGTNKPQENHAPSKETLTERLEYELDTIRSMGYVDYFLIVWDFINYAKTNGIMVGPGRGSAAGSIVAYCLGITDIDPIKYNLLFERFLNPERVSMPDIDVDFCVERRQEVIDYVARKYGEDHVAQIVTFGTLAARGVIRDVGRVLDMPYAVTDNIAKMVPQTLHITLDQALRENKELRELYDEDEQVKRLIDMSKRLEGLPRHASMHAAGVVICAEPVDEYVPLSRASDGSITTQFVMTTLEELGLLKMDFLGLRNLTVIQNAVRFVEKNRGIKLDMLKIDYNDRRVMDLIGSGKTEGIFQLESGGMKNFMKELKPRSLEDIIAGISLYRPGPMDFIPKYLKGKNHPESITYDCPQLEPILKPTYGCIVYQEQVMQIVRDLAGFTLGRSDLLRRAMSKKKLDVMQRERQNFVYGNEKEGIAGCVSNGIDERTANKIYDEMIDFAKYAFNKSHAAAYAVVACQTAYLKQYYPVEFMAAMLTSVMDRTDKIAEYIYTCRSMGIKILPPDINEGESGFSVSGNSIRYGLTAIKSIGGGLIDKIVSERNENGRYLSLEDFIRRTVGKDLNRRAIENLIKAGAFDSLNGTRKQFMMAYISILDKVNSDRKNNMSGQISLFDLAGDNEKEQYRFKLPAVGEFSGDQMLQFEKEVLGIYISGHPLQEQENKWRNHITNMTSDFNIPDGEEDVGTGDTGGTVLSDSAEDGDGAKSRLTGENGRGRLKDHQRVTVGGIITNVTRKYTSSGQPMAFLTLEDLVGSVEVIVFPKLYERCRELITEDVKIFVTGSAEFGDNEQGKVLAGSVVSFDQIPAQVWIRFPDKGDYVKRAGELSDVISKSRGNDKVIIYLEKERSKKILPDSERIDADADTVRRLGVIFGEENVKVVDR